MAEKNEHMSNIGAGKDSTAMVSMSFARVMCRTIFRSKVPTLRIA